MFLERSFPIESPQRSGCLAGDTTGEPTTALRDHHRIPFDVAIDDIDGTLHRAFGTRPSSAYLIDSSGTIVFRAHCSPPCSPSRRSRR